MKHLDPEYIYDMSDIEDKEQILEKYPWILKLDDGTMGITSFSQVAYLTPSSLVLYLVKPQN